MSTASAASLGIVSPHLDDAVLSCGRLLAVHPGTEVVTVFSSGPDKVDPLPWWDQMCGVFRPGDDVMAVRRQEDADALAAAQAQGHHLGFWDEQYRGPAPLRLARLRPGAARRQRARHDDTGLAEQIRGSLRRRIEEAEPATWFVPLGLHRGDHELVARICIDLVRVIPAKRWVVYEELPYRSECPDKVIDELESLRRQGYVVEDTSFVVDAGHEKKTAMVTCHRSQLDALGDRVHTAIEGDEVFHAVSYAGPSDS